MKFFMHFSSFTAGVARRRKKKSSKEEGG